MKKTVKLQELLAVSLREEDPSLLRVCMLLGGTRSKVQNFISTRQEL